MAYVTATTAKATNTALAEYTDAQVNAKVAEFEDILERYCSVAYTTRTATEQITRRPLRSTVQLANPRLISLTSITVDGTVLSLTNVARLKTPGVLMHVPFTDPCPLDCTIVYTHGYATTPVLAIAGAVEYAARSLAADNSGTSRDVRSQAFDGGTTNYITPDWSRGRPTGWTEVDRLLNSCDDYRTGFA